MAHKYDLQPEIRAHAQAPAIDERLMPVTVHNASERIASVLSILSRDRGWTLEELEGMLGFKSKYRREGRGWYNHSMPKTAAFIDLNQHIARVHNSDSAAHPHHFAFNFALGMQRTSEDPKSGLVGQYWFNHNNLSYVTHNVTSFAGYSLRFREKPVLKVEHVQSSTIEKDDVHKVLAELHARRDLPEQAGEGSMEHRIKSLAENGVPWAYPDRTLLFGPLAVWMARQLNIDTVEFNPKGCQPPIYERTFKFTQASHHEGIMLVR